MSLTGCAVRGLDMVGGRVAGVITEKGRIKCDGVVLAGGAWSRLFCGAYGITLPQLKVLSSVVRTAPIEGLPESSTNTGEFAFRKRLDGGYNIAGGGNHTVPIVPDTFRFFVKFLPALRAEWGQLHLRLDDRFMTEARTPKRWAMDEPSPFEAVRVLDPTPDTARSEHAVARMKALFPRLRGHADRAALGRTDRRHARRGAGHQHGRGHSRPGDRHRLFRPRLRHRSRRRAARRRPCRRR